MPKNLLFTGYAKFPAKITAEEVYNFLCISLELETGTGRIVDADCTLATELARGFFTRIVKGHSLTDDFKYLEAEIDKRYYGNAKRALVTALRRIKEQYEAHINSE